MLSLRIQHTLFGICVVKTIKIMWITFIPLPSLIVRVFLSSSRSYRNYIAVDSELELAVKILINRINMPKFVWIAELTTIALVQDKKASGLIIMDATEPLKSEFLACLIENTYIGTINDVPGRYPIALNPFKRFNNLKTF